MDTFILNSKVIRANVVHDYLRDMYLEYLEYKRDYGKDSTYAFELAQELNANKKMIEELLNETITFRKGQLIEKDRL